MIKKKILFVATKAIFPALTGDTQIIYNRLLELSKSEEFEISLLITYRNKKNINGISEYEKLCKNTWLFKLSFLDDFKSVFKIFFGDKRPFQVIFYDNDKINNKIKHVLLSNNFDIINLYLIRSSFFLKVTPNNKVIMDMIDLMSLNFKKRSHKAKSWLLSVIYNLEYKRLVKYEKYISGIVDKIVLVAEKEADQRNDKIEIVPLGVNTNNFKPINHQPNFNIIFSGNMSYQPNIQAVEWFIDNCFYKILSKYKDCKLIIAGANPSNKIINYRTKNITITGYVESLPKTLNSASIAIAPMQSGSGMQFKVLEAMSCGLPLVVTTLGLGSIKAIDRKEVLVADDADKFCAVIIDFFENREKYKDIRKSSRNFVIKNYSWTSHIQKIKDIFWKI